MQRRNGVPSIIYESNNKKYNYCKDTISSFTKRREKYVNDSDVLSKMLLELFMEKDIIQKQMQLTILNN